MSTVKLLVVLEEHLVLNILRADREEFVLHILGHLEGAW